MSVVDAAEGGRPADVEHDVCVVGGGAAGITLALELGAAGFDVVVCEGGAREPSDASADLYRGESDHGAPYYPLHTTRLRYLGGSTNHWGGYCRPLDAEDFTARPHLGLTGWPIDLAALEDDYRRAEVLCELPEDGWDAASQLEAVGAAPLEVDASLLRTEVFLQSPPTRFGLRYADELEEAASVTVVLNANLVEIETADRAHVDALRFSLTDGSDTFGVRARRYVLATGGIENARLLLHTDTGRGALGDSGGMLGRCFMEHPHYMGSAYVLTSTAGNEVLAPYRQWNATPDGALVLPVLVPPEEWLRERGLTRVMVSLEAPATPDEDRFDDLELRGVRSLMRFRGEEPSGAAVPLILRCEQLPNPRSRVTLTPATDALGLRRAALAWHLDRRDLATLEQFADTVVAQLAALGVGRVHEGRAGARGWPELTGGHHHMGTTRMHEDPQEGVVDADCRVHGVDNLYVAGSSVFTTSGYANPTLTVVALAVRLARHLREVA